MWCSFFAKVFLVSFSLLYGVNNGADAETEQLIRRQNTSQINKEPLENFTKHESALYENDSNGCSCKGILVFFRTITLWVSPYLENDSETEKLEKLALSAIYG